MRTRILQFYLATAVTVCFALGVGLVEKWGEWYSPNVAYREQTEAFFRGSLALHTNPTTLRNDLVWHNGGVHQVWGLGIPFWRLPFELVARVFGNPAFPDRIEFCAAYLVIVLLVIKNILPDVTAVWDLLKSPFRIVGAAVILLFPPFVTMCRFRFDVYEEAACYSYLFGIGLFIGMRTFVQRPTLALFLVMSALSGFAPIIRPTAGAYGLITMAVLWFYARRDRFKVWQFLAGGLMFCSGGILLFLTNQIRFGAGFEFGHSLNLNGFPTWFYTRIYNPFQHEPLFTAARELFGFYFFDSRFNGLESNLNNIFYGQSFTPRWRNMYFTGYDFTFLLLLIISWGACFLRAMPRIRKVFTLPAECQIACCWSVISMVMLTAFYLHSSILSSRYILDTGPAVAAAIISLLLALEHIAGRHSWAKRLITSLVTGIASIWLGFELLNAQTDAGPSKPVDRMALLNIMRQQGSSFERLPNKYEWDSDRGERVIPYNRAGWDSDGRMSTVVVLFIESPDYFQIHISPLSSERVIDLSKIEVKIGLEVLQLESVKLNGTEFVVRFKGPSRQVYQKGIQEAFLAYVDKDNCSSSLSPIRLNEVQWRNQ